MYAIIWEWAHLYWAARLEPHMAADHHQMSVCACVSWNVWHQTCCNICTHLRNDATHLWSFLIIFDLIVIVLDRGTTSARKHDDSYGSPNRSCWSAPYVHCVFNPMSKHGSTSISWPAFIASRLTADGTSCMSTRYTRRRGRCRAYMI